MGNNTEYADLRSKEKTRKQVEAEAKKRKRKKRRKELKKYYADSRLTKWEQNKRVEWDMAHG